MNCMNCKSVVDVGMEICPNCGFNLRVQRKCFSLSNMYYNLGLDKAEIRDLSGAIDMLRSWTFGRQELPCPPGYANIKVKK